VKTYINKILKEKKHFIYVVFTYRQGKRRREDHHYKLIRENGFSLLNPGLKTPGE